MARYCVRFLNELLDSTGHPHQACQRSLVVEAESEAAAVEQAQRAFERLEHVTHWDCHAGRLVCERLPREARSDVSLP